MKQRDIANMMVGQKIVNVRTSAWRNDFGKSCEAINFIDLEDGTRIVLQAFYDAEEDHVEAYTERATS